MFGKSILGLLVLLMDYYSRGLLLPLHWGHQVHKHHFSTTSAAIIGLIKSIFARHGIPEELVSVDNGPQFSAEQFDKFAKEYGFHHKPSSPKFPQANSEAERTVKTVKTISGISPATYPWDFWPIDLLLLRMDTVQLNCWWVVTFVLLFQ